MASLLTEKIKEMYLTPCTELDADGYGNPTSASCPYFASDCDDGAPSIHPEAAEVCDNGIDDGCSRFVDSLDADCGLPGPCAPAAEAAVTGAKRTREPSDLLGYLSGLALPVALVLLWRRVRRRFVPQ